MEPRISAVINTFNEEKNLPYALRSVQAWVDEIIVVDMHSTDRTVEVAREFGAKVHFHEPMGFVEPARAFAISKSSGDWVMVLDADELIPLPLSVRLLEIARAESADVVAVPRLNYLFGAPMMHSAVGPSQDRPLRFFRPGFLIPNGAIHGSAKPIPNARILKLPYKKGSAIVHFAYFDFWGYVEKLNGYTTIEAQQRTERGEHATPIRALAIPTGEFLLRYIKAGGYRDGWRGLYLSFLMAFYRLVTFAKIKELEKAGQPEAVKTKYRLEAERVLGDYQSARNIHLGQ